MLWLIRQKARCPTRRSRAWVFLWVNAAFFMGLFFFLAGYFTPSAFDRKGGPKFLADRGLRLGVRLLLGTLAIVPLQGWAHIALDPATPPVSYWAYLTRAFLGLGPKPDFWPMRALAGFQFRPSLVS